MEQSEPLPSQTSLTMLQRVRADDGIAWNRLSTIYGPLVYRWARQSGLQPDDASDIVQEVFRKLLRAIKGFRKEKPSDSFRGWLFTITKNTIRDFARKKSKQAQVEGGSEFYARLQELPDQCCDLDTSEGQEEASCLYQRALKTIKQGFADSTWQCFWRMTVDNEPAADIAEDLGLSTWTVYKAKARVLRKMKSEFAGLLD